MRVLIGCEYSGITRESFASLGWDAWSCDLLDTEIPGKHIKGNLLDILNDSWDLLIAHPPCQYLSYAGIGHWNKEGRLEKRLEALNFFAALWQSDIKHICLENPKSCAHPVIASYTQQIQPYYFGDPYIKTTWLWLKNLPKLTYSEKDTLFEKKSVVEPTGFWVNSSNSYRTKKKEISVGTRNAKERARSFPCIARAMAEQWTKYILKINL